MLRRGFFRLSTALLALGMAEIAQADPPGEPPLPQGVEEANGEEPSLPLGLEDAPEPALPTGLGGSDEPTLPSGLEDGSEQPQLPAQRDAANGIGEPSAPGVALPQAPTPSPLPKPTLHSRQEVRVGGFVGDDPEPRTLSMAELRVHIDALQSFRRASTTVHVAVDAVGDALAIEYAPSLDTGRGAIDLRAASLTTTPTGWFDLRVGRQILTWGTGDLLFINDLFPKDWTSFLIGRDVEYLKAPSDAAKLAFFTPWFDLDVVITPVFDADRPPQNHRVSSYAPWLGEIAGADGAADVERPSRFFRDVEVAARLYRSLGSWELSAYGYYGFWKLPAGFDPATGIATFPPLAVYGASIRGPVLGGIANAEVGYYDSLDDRGGRDALVRNSEARLLLGYEATPARNLTLACQYYLELMRFPERFDANRPSGAPPQDAARHVLTGRLRWFTARERLELSLFVFFSPSDLDGYLRPRIGYALNDRWHVSLGANVFGGREDYTFFGQLKYNTNVYGAVRFSI